METKSGANQCEHQKEISHMVQAYLECYPSGKTGFLVGSSLVGNRQGDSARFEELNALHKSICPKT